MGIVVVGGVGSQWGVLLDVVELGCLVVCLLLKLVHLGKLLLYLLNRHAVDVVGVPLFCWDVGAGSP